MTDRSVSTRCKASTEGNGTAQAVPRNRCGSAGKLRCTRNSLWPSASSDWELKTSDFSNGTTKCLRNEADTLQKCLGRLTNQWRSTYVCFSGICKPITGPSPFDHHASLCNLQVDDLIPGSPRTVGGMRDIKQYFVTTDTSWSCNTRCYNWYNNILLVYFAMSHLTPTPRACQSLCTETQLWAWRCAQVQDH